MQVQQQPFSYQTPIQIQANTNYNYQQMQYPVQSMPMQQIPVQPVGAYNNQSFEVSYGVNFDSLVEVVLGGNYKEYMNKKTAAIIVSIHSGPTYDGLFTQVQQKSQ